MSAGHAVRGAALAHRIEWGIPAQTSWALLAAGDSSPQPCEANPWGVAEELIPTPAFAPRSLGWRVQQFQLRRRRQAAKAREAERRRLRRLEHLDAMVGRCPSCGEWRMRNQPCEVLGCRSPLQPVPWPARRLTAI